MMPTISYGRSAPPIMEQKTIPKQTVPTEEEVTDVAADDNAEETIVLSPTTFQ